MISEVFNIDCVEWMKGQPDKFFDLAIVDPPYGIGEDGRRTTSRAVASKKWANPKPKIYKIGGRDNEPAMVDYFFEIKRVSKNCIVWGANHFIQNIPSANSSGWVVWHKKEPNHSTDFSDCELAYTSFKRGVRYFHFPWIGFGAINAKEDRIHPTQKPIKLYKWLLKNYAKPADKIFDSHMGSQSSRIAAHSMGFDYWGCEIDKEYFDAGNKRFENYKKQLTIDFK